MSTKRSMRLVPLLAALLAAPVMAEEAVSVEGEFHRSEPKKLEELERWAREGAMIDPAAAQLRLLVLSQERIEAFKRDNARVGNKMLRIGTERDLNSEIEHWEPDNLKWVRAPGGWKASLDVTVPGAEAVRVAVTVDQLPDGAWLRYQGGADEAQRDGADIERMRGLLDERNRFWTATTSGQTQRLEWFVPDESNAPPTWTPQVAGVSHLFADPHDPDFGSKALGASGSCNIDVACRLNQLGEAFYNVKSAVAHMAFQKGGGSYVCTGTLLNDDDPSAWRKWFYTAHHCIDSQAVANTLETYWNYETPTCNVDNRGANLRMTGGARHVYSSGNTDAALLELKGDLSENPFYFAGWDSAALAGGEEVMAIHHPRGDIKKVSFGKYLRPESGVPLQGQTMDSAWRVTWNEGTTEGGSSGSGLFALRAETGTYRLRGGLAGGGASCGNSGGSEASGNYDYYSRFDQVFPAIRQYIYGNSGGNGNGNGGATHDYTGQWVTDGQNRRGLSMFRLSSGGLFILWFRYDSQNRPVWYQLEDKWTANDQLGGRFARFSGHSNEPNWTGSYTIVFDSANTATFTYTNVDGDSGSIVLRKAGL